LNKGGQALDQLYGKQLLFVIGWTAAGLLYVTLSLPLHMEQYKREYIMHIK
jgi:hypothetical protein